MIYQGIYIYLIQKHKMFKKIAKNFKGHYKIKKKKSNDIFITQLARQLKASLTFKCMTEHLFADFSYSIALDTYL